MSDYDVLAVIEEKKASQDDCGNVSVSEEPVWRGWVRVREMGSTEYWQACAVNEQETVKLFARPSARLAHLTPSRCRVRLAGYPEPLDIASVGQTGGRDSEVLIRASRKRSGAVPYGD